MLTALTSIVLAVIALVLVMLGFVVVGIRREPPDAKLSDVAPGPIASMVRRLLGLYVRRPTPSMVTADRQDEGSPDMPAAQTKATT